MKSFLFVLCLFVLCSFSFAELPFQKELDKYSQVNQALKKVKETIKEEITKIQQKIEEAKKASKPTDKLETDLKNAELAVTNAEKEVNDAWLELEKAMAKHIAPADVKAIEKRFSTRVNQFKSSYEKEKKKNEELQTEVKKLTEELAAMNDKLAKREKKNGKKEDPFGAPSEEESSPAEESLEEEAEEPEIDPATLTSIASYVAKTEKGNIEVELFTSKEEGQPYFLKGKKGKYVPVSVIELDKKIIIIETTQFQPTSRKPAFKVEGKELILVDEVNKFKYVPSTGKVFMVEEGMELEIDPGYAVLGVWSSDAKAYQLQMVIDGYNYRSDVVVPIKPVNGKK